MTVKNQHLNERGMTLLELVVAMVIFAIAALMLSTGFVSAFRYMSESSRIKNTSNHMQTLMEQDTFSDEEKDLLQEQKQAVITYTLEDQTTVQTTGTFRRIEEFYDDTQSLTLGNMIYSSIGESSNEQKGEQLYTLCEGWNKEWANNVHKKTNETFAQINDIIRTQYTGSTITANNDLYRIYLFYGYYPELYQQVQGTWPTLDFSNISNELTVLKNKDWYVKIFFTSPVLSDRIIYADNTNTKDSSWSGKQMFYINAAPGESEGSWYYNTQNKSYMLTSFNTASDGTQTYKWEEVKAIIRNEQEGWKKITYQ